MGLVRRAHSRFQVLLPSWLGGFEQVTAPRELQLHALREPLARSQLLTPSATSIAQSSVARVTDVLNAFQ